MSTRATRPTQDPMEMTSEEVIRWLFPRGVIERAKAGRLRIRSARQTSSSEGNMEPTSLLSRFDPEGKSRSYLEALRWPDGVSCPRCAEMNRISRIERRGQFDCGSCGYQFSVRVGTVLANSHLPLWKWLLAAYLMSEPEGGVSANKLKEVLGVPYKTSWYLCHRIRAGMKDEAAEPVARQVAIHEPAGPSTNISSKHLPRYIDEITFRANNRVNQYRFRDIALRLVGAGSLRYRELTASA